MLLATVVAASQAVAATRSRKAKVAELATLLREAEPDERAAVVAFLSGRLTQGRLGVGWRTLTSLDSSPADEPQLTVTEVDEALTKVAQTPPGTGSTTARLTVMQSIFHRATKDEQRFLMQLIMGELRQGALEGVMLDAIAAASGAPGESVRRAFMLSGRLPETAAAALSDDPGALDRFRLQLGRPVRPMLASPAGSLPEAMEIHERSVVEYKLDGARIQVHKYDGQVRIWTRTLREITPHVSELAELVRELPCESVVLDGETLALTDDGRPRPFQETQARFGSTTEEQVRALLLRPYFFDCLHLDGADLLDAALHERREALHSVASEHVIPGEVSPPDPAEVLDAALADGHEGVVVKNLESPYAAGRRGKAWLKVKPVHTLDLVVIGAEWGHGRRTGYLSNLHLGARDPDGGPPIMVGKTFKGLTDELLRWQTEEFPRYAVESSQWHVQMRPALVVEIALDGVQRSTRYPGGVALRFARVVRYRPDKTPAEADTIDSVRALLR
ncbi:ATP-dependent DNA ligase [Thermocrispum municipale]|uniref:ATP-dependent DNA ligase n=1 Tax=Thermocrispum municipale TaxID=37926 RepID=UPI000416D167|nr:ATP-dependent DNA ligase [Thermocrispum municipale]